MAQVASELISITNNQKLADSKYIKDEALENKKQSDINKDSLAGGVYNVTKLHSLQSGYYTITTAIAAVPQTLRCVGMVITYQTASDSWETKQFKGALSDWTDSSKWEDFGGGEAGDGVYDISAAYPNASPFASLQAALTAFTDTTKKKGGMTIKYIGTDGKYYQYRYILADLSGFSNENNWEESTQTSDLGDKEIDSGITLGSISTASAVGISVVKGTNKVTITGTSYQGKYGAFWDCSSLEAGKEYHIRFHAVTTNGSNAANWRLMCSSKAASSDSNAVVQTLNTTYHTAGEEDIDVTFTFDATKPYIGFLNWQSSSTIHLYGGSKIVVTEFSIISIQDGIEKKITSLEDAVESLDEFKNSLVDGSGVDGKGLSSNDFTDEYKQAVEGIGQGGDSSELQEVVLGKEIDSGIQQGSITAANTIGINLNVTASKVTITGSTYQAMYGAFWNCSTLEDNKEYRIRFHAVTTNGSGGTANWRLMMSSSQQSSNTGVTLKPLSGTFHQAGEEDIDEVFTFKSSTPYIGFLNYETYQANTVTYNNLKGGCKVVVTNFSIVEIQKGLVDDVEEIKEEIDNISDNIDLTPINTKIASVAKPLSNKNIAILGDSITHVEHYPNTFFNICGYKNKIVCGVDGTAWVYRSNEPNKAVGDRIDDMIAGINEQWIPDIIIIALGINDSLTNYGAGLPIGSPDVAIMADDSTIAEMGTVHNSIRYAVKRLRSLYPNVKIFLQGVQWCKIKNETLVTTSEQYKERADKLFLYNDAIHTAALYNGCTFIDVMSDGVCEDTIDTYTGDGLHDNAAGGVLHGRCVAAAVLAQYGITFMADRL